MSLVIRFYISWGFCSGVISGISYISTTTLIEFELMINGASGTVSNTAGNRTRYLGVSHCNIRWCQTYQIKIMTKWAISGLRSNIRRFVCHYSLPNQLLEFSVYTPINVTGLKYLINRYLIISRSVIRFSNWKRTSFIHEK